MVAEENNDDEMENIARLSALHRAKSTPEPPPLPQKDLYFNISRLSALHRAKSTPEPPPLPQKDLYFIEIGILLCLFQCPV